MTAVPLTLFSIAVAGMYLADALNHGDGIWPSVYIILLPSMIAVPIVTVVTVLFGLPVHWMLVRRRWASNLAYSLAGGVVGFALPMSLVVLDGSVDNLALPMLGLVSGAATGHAWWRGRTFGDSRP